MLGFLKDLLRPRVVPNHGQGLYKPVPTYSNNADELVYESFQGRAAEPLYRGYYCAQAPGGTNGANPLPIFGGAYRPLLNGYSVGQPGHQNRLTNSPDSLPAQELV